MLINRPHQESRLKYALSSDRPLTPGVRDAAVDRISFFLS